MSVVQFSDGKNRLFPWTFQLKWSLRIWLMNPICGTQASAFYVRDRWFVELMLVELMSMEIMLKLSMKYLWKLCLWNLCSSPYPISCQWKDTRSTTSDDGYIIILFELSTYTDLHATVQYVSIPIQIQNKSIHCLCVHFYYLFLSSSIIIIIR